METRQYQSTDLVELIFTWEQATQVGHPFLSKEFIESEKKSIASEYLPNGDAWVAVIQGHVVGFTILHQNEVGALFVQPEFHGLGVGYALMLKAHQLHDALKVEVFKENVIGTQFYLRFGFKYVREYLHQESDREMLCLEYEN